MTADEIALLVSVAKVLYSMASPEVLMAVFLTSTSCIARIPGRIMPPRWRPRASRESMVVAVPQSTTRFAVLLIALAPSIASQRSTPNCAGFR